MTVDFKDYIKVTDLAKEKGKEVKEWLKSSLVKKKIKKLESELNIKVCHARKGGNDLTLQGTFIHPKLLPYFQDWLNKEGNYTHLTVSRDEEDFKKLLEKSFSGILTFESQKKVDNYRLDFYCPELNLAIEYDERQHKTPSTSSNDDKRQAEIEKLYGYKFLRVNQGKEIEGINQLIKLVLNK